MEDQIGTVMHWSNQKEPKQAKNNDEVIRRNLDRIRVSTATFLPSNPSRHSQVRYGSMCWSSASLRPLSADTPGASVWPSPRQMPGQSPSL